MYYLFDSSIDLIILAKVFRFVKCRTREYVILLRCHEVKNQLKPSISMFFLSATVHHFLWLIPRLDKKERRGKKVNPIKERLQANLKLKN